MQHWLKGDGRLCLHARHATGLNEPTDISGFHNKVNITYHAVHQHLNCETLL